MEDCFKDTLYNFLPPKLATHLVILNSLIRCKKIKLLVSSIPTYPKKSPQPYMFLLRFWKLNYYFYFKVDNLSQKYDLHYNIKYLKHEPNSRRNYQYNCKISFQVPLSVILVSGTYWFYSRYWWSSENRNSFSTE